jgi:hypothetical protein
MGNNRQYRLALNSTVWTALSWCILLDPAKGFQAFTVSYQFMNYWRQDADVQYREGGNAEGRMRQRTDVEKVRFYLLSRAQGFFEELCNDPQMNDQHIDAIHFLTESLLHLFTISNQEPKNPAMREIYNTAEEVIAYEKVMKEQIFDRVQQNYVALKQFFQKTVEANNQIKMILEFQNQTSKSFSSPLIKFDVFLSFLAAADPKKEKHRLLREFIDQRKILNLLQYLPDMVHFYKVLQGLFAYRLTEEEANGLTVPECIDRLKGFESEETIRNVRKMFESMKEKWSIVVDVLGALPACRDQQERREFESYIMTLDDKTLFGSLISHYQNLEAHDEILRTIQGLLKRQDGILSMRTSYSEGWNWNQLLFEDQEDSYLLSSLPNDIDNQHMLLTGDLDGVEFEFFALSQAQFTPNLDRAKIQFDLLRIERQVLERYTCGVCLFKDINSTFRQPFPFLVKEDSQAPQSRQSQANKMEKPNFDPKTIFDSLHAQLKRLSRSYQEEIPLQDKKRYQQILSKKVKREDELIQAATFLCQSVEVILHSNESNLPSKTFGFIKKELDHMPVVLRGFSDVPLRYLSEIANLIKKKFLEKDYLFADLSKQVDEPFDEKIEHDLNELKKKIHASSPESINEWMRICQSLSELLREPENINLINTSLGGRLADVFQKDIIRLSRDGSMTAKNIELIFHPKLRCENLAPFLRFLHFLSGELTIQMQTKRRNDTSNEYKEKIPKELEHLQTSRVDLNLSTAPLDVPPPADEGAEDEIIGSQFVLPSDLKFDDEEMEPKEPVKEPASTPPVQQPLQVSTPPASPHPPQKPMPPLEESPIQIRVVPPSERLNFLSPTGTPSSLPQQALLSTSQLSTSQLETHLQLFILFGEKKKRVNLPKGFKFDDLKAAIFQSLDEDPNAKEIAKIKLEDGVTVDSDRDCTELTHRQNLLVSLKVILHLIFFSF